jgi:hypothetical protein
MTQTQTMEWLKIRVESNDYYYYNTLCIQKIINYLFCERKPVV